MSLATSAKHCLICDKLLPPLPLRKGEHPLCRDTNCRFTHDLLRRQYRLCKFCGRPIDRPQAAGGLCPSLSCRHGMMQAQLDQDRRRELDCKLTLALRLRDQQASSLLPFANPASFPPAIVPAHTANTTPLPISRLRAYRKRLKTLIRQALTHPRSDSEAESEPEADPLTNHSPAAPVSSPLARVNAHACGLCRGHCCRKGGEHAYLSPDTFKRYLASHPSATPRQLFKTYARSPGSLTIEDSCVNHGPTGCTLPRVARSDTCNDFLCEDLHRFNRSQQPDQPPRAFFLSLDQDNPRAAAFIEEAGLVPVSVAPLSDTD